MTDADDVDWGAPQAKAGFRLRKMQAEWVEGINIDRENKLTRLLIDAPGGIGKCLGVNTPILMFDGSIKPVQNVVVGDVLIGPDSLPRVVTATTTGRENLWRVVPVKGDAYIVNESHILSFKVTVGDRYLNWKGSRYFHGDVINMSVAERLVALKHVIHSTVGWRSSADFPTLPLNEDMPPYMLGLWLGDGNKDKYSISKPDPEILASVQEYAHSLGYDVVTQKSGPNDCPTHNVVVRAGAHHGRGHKVNRAKNALESLGLLCNKHIPHPYKTASRNDRLQLIAGLLDADGHFNSGGYDYITKDKALCEDLAFVCRSIGLSAYYYPCKKGCQGGFVGDYWRMGISGDCSIIPCRIARRRAPVRQQRKSNLVTGITLEPVGAGDYYGFTLGGTDGLFLLGDFTVTHNTTAFSALAKKEWEAKTGKTLVLANRDRLVRQTADRVRNETGLDCDIEMAENRASPFAPIVVASVQTLGKLNRLTSFSDDHFSLVVPDEAHRSAADGPQRIINYFHYGAASLEDGWVKPMDGQYTPKAHIIGFTATPDIGTKRSLGEFYQKYSARYTYINAVEDGWLVPPQQICVPVKIDLTKFKPGRTTNGTDFSAEDLTAAMIPILEELADQIVKYASDRKTMCFLPSVECARLMAEALERKGLAAIFVSGQCLDVDEKTDAFQRAGKGTVMTLCAIYVEGIDFPDVDCIAWFRATISKAFYIQGVYRGTRVLPGLVNDDMTAEERRAAIDGSSKKDVLILDPLFVSDRIDLCDYRDLVTNVPEVKAAMKAGPILESAKEAERDFIKSLEKAAKKNERKKARFINPLSWAVSMGDPALVSYEPETEWEKAKPSPEKIKFLEDNGVNTSGVYCQGLADKLVDRLIAREKMKLATPKMMQLLITQFGFSEEEVATMSRGKAGAIIGKGAARWKR